MSTLRPSSFARRLRVAFSGASGTGKSSLAAHVAVGFSLPMNPVGSRSVAAAMGFASPYDVDAAGKRLAFQERLIEEKLAWELGKESFVTDRTPLDNLAYVMMHGGAGTVSVRYLEAFERNIVLYTHVFVCPIAAFQKMGDDPARKHEPEYHHLYEAALVGLLDAYVPVHKRFVVNVSEAILRKKFVDEVLA